MDHLQEAIALVEKHVKVDIRWIKPIENGQANDLFFVNYELVVRLMNRNQVDEPFRRLYGEFYLYKTLSERKLEAPLPGFLYYSPNSFAKIEAFVPGVPAFTQGHDEEDALAAVRSLSELHMIAIKDGPFKPFDRFNAYKKASKKRLPTSFEKTVLRRVGQIVDERTPVMCHNRLNSSHILLHEGNAVFLDFETAGLNPSIFDIASLVEENDFPTPLARKCLSYYSSLTLEGAYSFEELEYVVAFWDAFWFYWNYARFEETGNEAFKVEAEKKKKRFLFVFDTFLMNGAE